jgi:alcohol dehydrogenase class IV/protocatechuate 3,4-dioxygenase beta subunit
MQSFVYTSQRQRVVFGTGTVAQIQAEVAHLAGKHPFLIASRRVADRITEALAPLTPIVFTAAAMHTPVEVTEQAMSALRDADCLVAVGGGSATGLAKALALRTDLPQVIVPTTYAGSEATSVLGETSNGHKVTRRSPALLPETVIYDVALTLGLPVPMTVTSAINALAHAVEAMYAPDANPVTTRLAHDAIAGIASALPRVAKSPDSLEAREDLLQAAWLAGMCLGAVTMGPHHKLAHILGGSFGLPHAETHTVLLPHTMADRAPAAPAAFAEIAEAMGAADAPTAVYDLIDELGGPTTLNALGMASADLPKVATQVAESPGIETLLINAWRGNRPSPTLSPTRRLTAEVVASFAATQDPRTKHLFTDLVEHLHRYVAANDVTEAEWRQAIEFLTQTGQKCDDKRQEFILLSDTLGVSSMVDLMTNSRTTDTTPSAVLGPFYVDGPPTRPQGYDIAADLPGKPLWVDVTVTDRENKPIPKAVVDVWQSNDEGYYDVQLDLDAPVLRARFATDDDGRLKFWTIVPSAYPIPADGPVGELLTKVGRHPYRAPHVHFMISAPGHTRLTTQLFVAGGEYLDSDTVFGVKPELIVDFKERTDQTPDGRELKGEWHELTYNFKIA